MLAIKIHDIRGQTSFATAEAPVIWMDALGLFLRGNGLVVAAGPLSYRLPLQ